MDRREALYGFDFDDHTAIGDQVEAVACVQALALINDWQSDLFFYRNTANSELVD